MKTVLILLGVVLLVATVFLGGIFTTVKAGEKDGICDYDYKE